MESALLINFFGLYYLLIVALKLNGTPLDLPLVAANVTAGIKI